MATASPIRSACHGAGVASNVGQPDRVRVYAAAMPEAADTAPSFAHRVTSTDELAGLYRAPSQLVLAKKRAALDAMSTAFIELSSFVLVGTSDATGAGDVSPRGGPPGFVKVLDSRRLAIPDMNGNNLIDSLTNIIANPHVGLLFVVPGKDETVRVNGRACLTTDPAVLDLFADEIRRPTLAIGVDITDTYIHCAKAFRRGNVWTPAAWNSAGPDAVDILRCQFNLDMPAVDLRANFENGYQSDLALDAPDQG
jgi:uncharacterized protein